MNHCLHCKSLTVNPKFCSRSCAASYNNKTSRKRLPEGRCSTCNIPIKKSRKYCKTCFQQAKLTDWTKITVKECQSKRSYQVNSRIRDLARRLYKTSTRKQTCAYCDYTNHSEVHHIKAINLFSLNTPVSEINHIDNLIALCPNHHWEADNNIIDEQSLRLHRI